MQVHSLYDKALLEPGFHPSVQSYYYHEWTKRDMQQHMHNRMEIMYVIKGECTVRAEQEKIRLLAGDFILVDAGRPHALSIQSQRGCMVLNIEFIFEKTDSPAPDLALLYKECPALQALMAGGPVPYLKVKDNGEMYRILSTVVDHVDISVSYSFTVDLWMAQMLMSTAALSGARPGDQEVDYVQMAKDYVGRNFSHEIHVGDIARFIHIHPAYLQRLFKKECGVSVVDYLTEVRMQKAYDLLVRTNMSILDIAGSVGINSQQYFTRLFKKTVGMTPKALRDSNTADRPNMDGLPEENGEWHWRPGLSESLYETDSDWQGEDCEEDSNR